MHPKNVFLSVPYLDDKDYSKYNVVHVISLTKKKKFFFFYFFFFYFIPDWCKMLRKNYFLFLKFYFFGVRKSVLTDAGNLNSTPLKKLLLVFSYSVSDLSYTNYGSHSGIYHYFLT